MGNLKKTQKKSSPNTIKHICEFCGKQAAKYSTIERHYENCQKRMRFEIRNTDEVQVAFRLWNSIQTHTRKIEDFENSNLYKTFLDFVTNMIDKNCHLIYEYGIWLLKNKISIYHWKKTSFFEQFIHSFISGEHPRDAVTRSIGNIEKTGKFGSFFDEYSTGRILMMIETGKISPWLIILSESSDNFISRLRGEQLAYFSKIINISVWQRKMDRYPKICQTIKSELSGIDI